MLSSETNVTDQRPADTKSKHMLPGEQVHVVGHAGQALALPDDVVFLLLPLLHLRVHVRRQQTKLQTQLGHACLLLREDNTRANTTWEKTEI